MVAFSSPPLHISRDVRRPAEYLEDPLASEWLKQALRSALERDPVDAANDADLLRAILFGWATQPEPPTQEERDEIGHRDGTEAHA
jgi:hypothetical protein